MKWPTRAWDTTLSRPEVRVVLALGIQTAAATALAVLTARWLGPSDRGVLVTFVAASMFLMLIGSAGVPTGGRVLLADRLSMSQYLSAARTLSALHVVASATVGLGLLWISHALPNPVVAVLFVATAVSQLYGYFQREGIHGIGFHVTAISGEVLSATVQIAVVCVAYQTGHLRVELACGAVLVGSIAQNTYLWNRIRALQPAGIPGAEHLTFADIVQFSSPAALGVFCQAFAYRGDRLVLAALTTTAAVGIYSVAATLAEVIGLVSVGVSQVVFRRMAAAGCGPWYPRIRGAALLVSALAGVLMALGARPIVLRVLGEPYAPAIAVSYVLIAAVLPLASYNLDIAALSGLGKLRTARRINMIGAGILAGLCLVTIPLLGIWGATASSVATYCVMAGLARRELVRCTAEHAPVGTGRTDG